MIYFTAHTINVCQSIRTQCLEYLVYITLAEVRISFVACFHFATPLYLEMCEFDFLKRSSHLLCMQEQRLVLLIFLLINSWQAFRVSRVPIKVDLEIFQKKNPKLSIELFSYLYIIISQRLIHKKSNQNCSNFTTVLVQIFMKKSLDEILIFLHTEK